MTDNAVILPVEPGLRCVIWPRTGNYWTASSRVTELPIKAVNQNCWSVIGWSIAGDNPPVPILSNGKFSSLGDPASANTIALIHANGMVEWQGQFFANVDEFVSAARINESSQGK